MSFVDYLYKFPHYHLCLIGPMCLRILFLFAQQRSLSRSAIDLKHNSVEETMSAEIVALFINFIFCKDTKFYKLNSL